MFKKEGKMTVSPIDYRVVKEESGIKVEFSGLKMSSEEKIINGYDEKKTTSGYEVGKFSVSVDETGIHIPLSLEINYWELEE